MEFLVSTFAYWLALTVATMTALVALWRARQAQRPRSVRETERR